MSSHKSETAADNGLEFADATKQKKKQIQCKYYEMKLKEGSLSPFYHMNIWHFSMFMGAIRVLRGIRSEFNLYLILITNIDRFWSVRIQHTIRQQETLLLMLMP